MLGPRPSSLTAPSTWYAAEATPHQKSWGKAQLAFVLTVGFSAPFGKVGYWIGGGGMSSDEGTGVGDTVVLTE